MATGEIVFKRGKDEYDAGLWDDSALIKAYDQAIDSFKKKNKIVDTDKSATVDQSSEQPNKSQKKNKKKNKKKRVSGWQVGNRCQAIYSEDGLAYDALIISIDESSQKCVVKYRGYGNEEEQHLSSLIPLNRSSSVSTSNMQSEVENESDYGTPCWKAHPLTPDPKSKPANHRHTNETHKLPAGNGCSRHSRKNPMPPPMSAGIFSGFNQPSSLPFVPPGMFPPFPGSFGNSAVPPVIPLIPPPPMPDMDCISDDRDALYGMLISWYMSGYHTGYYQGLKNSSNKHVDDREPSSADLSDLTSS